MNTGIIARRFIIKKYLAGFEWYDWFERHDQGMVTYIPLMMVDNIYSRLIYLAGMFQHNTHGNIPALIPMKRAIFIFKLRIKRRFACTTPAARGFRWPKSP